MASENKNHYYIEGLRNGHSEAISELYQTLLPAVKRYVKLNSGNEEDAKDVFQIVLLQVSTRIRALNFSTDAPIEAYLVKACKFQWLKVLKRRSSKGVTKELTEEYHSKEVMIQDTLDQEKYALFHEGMAQLSSNCQEVLKHFFEGKSGREMTAELGYGSESTLRQRIFKCKRKLMDIVQSSSRFKDLYL